MIRFSLFLLLATAALAQVPHGATRQQVIDALGWPVSTSSSTTREILNYPAYTVVLENGRVVSLQHKPAPAPARPGSRPAASPRPEPPKSAPAAPSKPPALPTIREPRAGSTTAPPARPTPPQVRQPTRAPKESRVAQNPWAPVHKTLIGLGILAAIAVAIRRVASAKRPGKRTRQEFRDRLLDPTARQPDSPTLGDNGGSLHLPTRLPIERPAAWSETLLKLIEWHRFEHLVCALEAESGHRAELTVFGADGGIDVRVTDRSTGELRRIVQCKAYGDQQVGVQLIREFFGVMVHHAAPEGAFYTTSTFTADARAFAVGKNFHLIDLPELLLRISRLGVEAQSRLLAVATEGDYTTPTCPSCGIKMVYRPARAGSFSSGFWGCTRYPRCRQKLHVRGPD